MSQDEKSQKSGPTTRVGGCHCGVVRFEADVDSSQGVSRCNCTLCVKRVVSGLRVDPDAFRLLAGQDALTEYRWGAKSFVFSFCKHCGIHVAGRGNIPQLWGRVRVRQRELPRRSRSRGPEAELLGRPPRQLASRTPRNALAGSGLTDGVDASQPIVVEGHRKELNAHSHPDSGPPGARRWSRRHQVQTNLHRSCTRARWGPKPARRPKWSAARSPRKTPGRARSRRSAASPRCAASPSATRSPGVVTRHPLRVGRSWCAPGQVLVELDTSVERAQLASAEARKELAALNAGRSRAARRERGDPAKAQLDADEAQLKTVERRRRRAAGADRSQDRARAVRRPARHPRGQPRAVPEPGHAGHRRSSRSARCTSTSRCRSSSSRAVKVGTPVRVTLDRRGRRRRSTARSAPSIPTHRRRHAHASSCAPASPTSSEQAAPRHVRQRRRSCCPSNADAW